MTDIELSRGFPGAFTTSVLCALDLEDLPLTSDAYPGSSPYSSVGEFRNWHVNSCSQAGQLREPVEMVKFYNKNKHSQVRSIEFYNATLAGESALCIFIHYETKKHTTKTFQIQKFPNEHLAFGVIGQQLNPPKFPMEIALLADGLSRNEVPLSGLLQSFVVCLTV